MGTPSHLRILLSLFVIFHGSLGHRGEEQGEQNKRNDAWPEMPSCSELANHWRNMHRINRHSLATNEIPIYPRGFVKLIHRLSSPWIKILERQLSRHSHQKPFAHTDIPPKVSFENVDAHDNLNELSSVSLDNSGWEGARQNDGNHQTFGMLFLPQRSQLKQEEILNSEFLPTPVPELEAIFHQRPLLNPEYNLFRSSSNHPKIIKVAHSKQSFPQPSFSTKHDILHRGYLAEGFEGLENANFPESMVSSPVNNLEESDPNINIDGSYENPQSHLSSKATTGLDFDDRFMGMFETVVHDSEVKDNLKENHFKLFSPPGGQWDVVDEGFGSFGNFADEDVSVGKFPSAPQRSSGVQASSLDATLLTNPDDEDSVHKSPEDLGAQKISCIDAEGSPCAKNSHCTCVGWVRLKCARRKCSINEQQTNTDFGKWHDGPLPTSQLGINRNRRTRRNKFTMM